MSFDESVPGWRSPQQLSWIRGLCAKYKSALEIGTYCSRTTRSLLESLSGPVFSVDPLTRITDVPSEAIDKTPWIEKLADDYPLRFVFIPGLSEELVWRRPIDVLLIDGDHRFDAVYDDLTHLARYVNVGGLLFLDAWDHPEKPDVRPAWEEYLRDNPRLSWAHQGNSKCLHAWTRLPAG